MVASSSSSLVVSSVHSSREKKNSNFLFEHLKEKNTRSSFSVYLYRYVCVHMYVCTHVQVCSMYECSMYVQYTQHPGA